MYLNKHISISYFHYNVDGDLCLYKQWGKVVDSFIYFGRIAQAFEQGSRQISHMRTHIYSIYTGELAGKEKKNRDNPTNARAAVFAPKLYSLYVWATEKKPKHTKQPRNEKISWCCSIIHMFSDSLVMCPVTDALL